MKKNIAEFLKRGFLVAWSGPIVVAVVYACLGAAGTVTGFGVTEVVTAIISSVFLAFIAGGVTAVYTIDRLSPFTAALLHGVVLYIDYLGIYLLNGWLKKGTEPIIVFTVIFVLTYLVIWAIVYTATKRSVKQLNERR